MRSFRGAVWVGPPAGPRVLLLSSTLESGARWHYTYSVSPGITVTVVTMPAPGMLPPTAPEYAAIVLDLVRNL